MNDENTNSNDSLQRAFRFNHALFQQATARQAIYDRNLRLVRVNEAFAKEYARPAEDFVGQDPFELFANDRAEFEAARRFLRRVLATKKPLKQNDAPYYFGNQPERGTTYWDLTLQPILDEQGEVEYIFFAAVEVTERYLADLALKKMNRELRAISDCNQVLVRAQDEKSLLDAICRIICDEAGYRTAWVGLADENGNLRTGGLSVGGSGLSTEGERSRVEGEGEQSGAMVAFRSGNTVCLQILEESGWQAAALEKGHHACIAMPLAEQGKPPFGVLAIYSGERNAFISEEIRLLEELAGDLAFGVVVLRAREEQNRIEQRRQEDLRFFQCLEQVNEAIQGETSVEDLMSDALDAVLECFGCDRAWLMYPCEIDAPTFSIPMERTNPEYPGALALGMKDIPQSVEIQQTVKAVLANPEPLTFGPEGDHPILSDPLDTLGAKSMIATAVYPIGAKAYMFGIHQCSYARPWTQLDRRIFREVARRITDALTVILSFQEILQLNQSLEKRVALRTAQLEASNRELEAFSYSVSHDLKEPLLHISGYCKLLLEENGAVLGEEGRYILQRALSATRRMDRLIEDLLELSQITHRSLEISPVDLSEMASEILGDLARREPTRRVHYSVMPNCVAAADPQLMLIVLQNVLGNAWKYTKQREEAEIEFGCRESVFYVRDNGAGFDMGQAGHLFVPFQRLHNTVEFPGSGIGLATVLRIIDRHNGRVWIEGEVDKGATLSFTLPDEFGEIQS